MSNEATKTTVTETPAEPAKTETTVVETPAKPAETETVIEKKD